MTIYDSIELSESELAAAILEGKKKKYFHEKNKDYWLGQEKTKPSQQGKERKEYISPSTWRVPRPDSYL